MTTQEIAKRLVNYCKSGDWEKAQKELYSKNAVSIEPPGSNWPERTEGLEAIIQKGNQFNEMVDEMHGLEVSEPLIADGYFGCTMTLDYTFKGMPRMKNSELCIYKVEGGKIVSEQFFASMN
jgi:hypothetical protein